MKENEDRAGYRDFTHYSQLWIRQIDRINVCRSFNEPNNFMRSVETLLSSLFPNLRNEVQEYIDTLPEQNEFDLCVLVFEKIIEVLYKSGYLKTTQREVETGSDTE